MKQFADTHTVAFRIVYALELTITFSLMLLIYLAKVPNPAPLGAILLATLGYLALVDTILSLTQKNVRNSFDIYHFIAAYALTGLALLIIYKLKTNPV